MNADELHQERVKVLRRDVLRLAYMTGDTGCNDKIITSALNGTGHVLTVKDVKRVLDYLEQQKTLVIADQDRDDWVVRLTPLGIDIVEKIVKAPDWMAKVP